MAFTNAQMIVSTLQEAYPKAKDSWIRRAAEYSINWASGNSNPSEKELEEFERQIKKMCTTGRWYS